MRENLIVQLQPVSLSQSVVVVYRMAQGDGLTLIHVQRADSVSVSPRCGNVVKVCEGYVLAVNRVSCQLPPYKKQNTQHKTDKNPIHKRPKLRR